MNEFVMVPAEQHPAVDRGLPVIPRPPPDVMHLRQVRWRRATWVLALPVAGDHGPPVLPGVRPLRPPKVQHLRLGPEHDPGDLGVAREPVQDRARQRGARVQLRRRDHGERPTLTCLTCLICLTCLTCLTCMACPVCLTCLTCLTCLIGGAVARRLAVTVGGCAGPRGGQPAGVRAGGQVRGQRVADLAEERVPGHVHRDVGAHALPRPDQPAVQDQAGGVDQGGGLPLLTRARIVRGGNPGDGPQRGEQDLAVLVREEPLERDTIRARASA